MKIGNDEAFGPMPTGLKKDRLHADEPKKKRAKTTRRTKPWRLHANGLRRVRHSD